jgi:hypothetical protein
MRKFKLKEVTLNEAFKQKWFPIVLTLFVLSVERNNPNRDAASLITGLVFVAMTIAFPIISYLRSGVVIISVDRDELRMKNRKFQFGDISHVEIIKLHLQVMAAHYPGFYLVLRDGEKLMVDQRMEDYTGFYQLLFKQGVKGSDHPLYIYDVDLDGNTKTMYRSYKQVYYPKTGKLVNETGIFK